MANLYILDQPVSEKINFGIIYVCVRVWTRFITNENLASSLYTEIVHLYLLDQKRQSEVCPYARLLVCGHNKSKTQKARWIKFTYDGYTWIVDLYLILSQNQQLEVSVCLYFWEHDNFKKQWARGIKLGVWTLPL